MWCCPPLTSQVYVHCGAECPSDCRGSACGSGRQHGDDTTSSSRLQTECALSACRSAECARKTTQTLEMCAVRGIVSSHATLETSSKKHCHVCPTPRTSQRLASARQHTSHCFTTSAICCFAVFGDEGVVAPRFSSSCTQKTHHRCQNVCTLGATSAAQMSGEKAFGSHERNSRSKEKHQRIESVSARGSIYDTCACLPSQPSPYCCSTSWMGEASKTLQQWTSTDHPSRKSGKQTTARSRQRNETSNEKCHVHVGNLARPDCTRDSRTSTAHFPPCADHPHRKK